MINATHFVIDLETMGKDPLAPIVAIGAALPRAPSSRSTTSAFPSCRRRPTTVANRTPPPFSGGCSRATRPAERSTAARSPTSFLPVALTSLSDWMAAHAIPEESTVWGNGSSFDNVILRSSYESCYLPLPWQFRHDRDLRTLLALYPEAKAVGNFEGTRHHALHDAKQLIAALGMHYGSAWGERHGCRH